MIGKDAEEVLNQAVRYAFERKHEYFTLEHVLLSLLEVPEILEIIQACGGSYTDLKKDLEDHLDRDVPKNEKKAEVQVAEEEDDDEDDELGEMVEHPVATLSIQRLIQRALFHVQSAGKDEIQPVDLFVALFQSKDSHSLHLLKKQGIERLDVLNFVSHGLAPGESLDENARDDDGADLGEGGTRSSRQRAKPSVLEQYTTSLNKLAKDGLIDPLVGRDNEIERMIQTLCRRRKNNPILVGEAGVGKTALAEGLALKVINGEVPEVLEKAELYSLDLGSLLAGAKFRGDFEQRIKRVLKSLEAKRQSGVVPILVIDEIHSIIGAGAVSGSILDAANLLKPYLARGELHCIGSTTYQEYRNTFEKDKAFARRFQKIDVPEPSKDEAVQILNGLMSKFSEHHDVRYADDVPRIAVELSAKHLTDRFLPDKAIDVIDEVGAKLRIKRMKEKTAERPTVTATDIEEIVAKIARIPARSVSTTQKARLKSLERDLKLSIFGQDHAIDALVTSIQLARSGLRAGERPVGSFLFCGPTGVGKTELSKQLAHCLGVPFLRFDMSEYMEKHTVSRLIGAPPGYVGFEQAGLLTDAVLKSPHSVVLLDEIEKSHFDVWNILLQIMDNGTLTDNNGRKVDFRNIILIMTSNVGTRDHERNPIGVQKVQSKETVSKIEIERTFSPEFRNRLDSIVYFNALDPVTIGQVVGKQLLELDSQLLAKGVEIQIESDVREWLAKKGYDRVMGARPMARLIQDQVKKPLAEEILFGKLEKGGKVVARMDGNEISFDIQPKSPKGSKNGEPVKSPVNSSSSKSQSDDEE